jgi:hypothetical protein
MKVRYKIFQMNRIRLIPITIPVKIARNQPYSILNMFYPEKSVSESKAYR